jgi:hypothetical protein
VRAALSGTINDGFIQRFQMMVWPDNRRDWVWVDRAPDLMAKYRYEDAFKAIHAIEGREEGPLVLRFTTEAQNLFREWMTEIQTEARSALLSPALESHILKTPKTVVSLALLFELIEGGRVAVGESATRRALGWAEYLLSHARRVYAAGEAMVENGARLILERRNRLPGQFTLRDIQRKCWAGLGDRDVVQACLDLLVTTYHCREFAGVSGPEGGRSSQSYRWNPRLLSEGR